jgi:transmembrane sensor
MTELNRTPDPDARLEEAAAWRVRLSETGLATSEAFEAWLADPENAAAWDQVEAGWDLVGAIASEPEIVSARRAALADAQRANAANHRNHVWRSFASIAATLLFVLLGTWGTLSWIQAPDHYSTQIGERRALTLADGSRVSLDSATEVSVKYSRTARELRLLRGQARFDVAHDVERPFSVVAGHRKIIATGTAFNIDIASGHAVVTLIQGRVAVLREEAFARPGSKHPIELEPGQQLTETANNGSRIAVVDLQRVTAWTTGQLIFANDTLNDVVEHMNRYTANPVVIADTRVGAMRISGVFNSSDTAGFVDTVSNYLPVQAATDDSGRVVLRAKK